ncbi:MAG: DUF2807 domain-containing protein, partial [Phenylobacterium sp.]|uniref:GIN domain-containing protein n=1 Tax=Phenylobacterium sp. TaxID=1871053 RepID=UPI001A4346B9
DAVARVTVVPEDRADIKVDIVRPHPRLPLTVRTLGDRTIVDGDLDHGIRGCNVASRQPHVTVRGVGRVDQEAMPQVVIYTPRNVALAANGAVVGAIGRSGSLQLSNSGCSAWTIADVAGEAEIHESGAGVVRMGASDRLEVHLSGAANINATRVRRNLDARLSGAGNVRIGELTGDMQVQVSGVGKIDVKTGKASSVRASVSGIGSVEFDGTTQDLDASISGLGGVDVGQVTGNVRKSVSGGGRVSIGNRPS